MVLKHDAHRRAGGRQLRRYCDIGLARSGAPARMIVGQDDCDAAEFDRAADYFSRIDADLVDGASRCLLVHDQPLVPVEMQDEQHFLPAMGKNRANIANALDAIGDACAKLDLMPEHGQADRMHGVDRRCHLLTGARSYGRLARGKQSRKTAKSAQQSIRRRRGIRMSN